MFTSFTEVSALTHISHWEKRICILAHIQRKWTKPALMRDASSLVRNNAMKQCRLILVHQLIHTSWQWKMNGNLSLTWTKFTGFNWWSAHARADSSIHQYFANYSRSSIQNNVSLYQHFFWCEASTFECQFKVRIVHM